jgi:hypothetical protein
MKASCGGMGKNWEEEGWISPMTYNVRLDRYSVLPLREMMFWFEGWLQSRPDPCMHLPATSRVGLRELRRLHPKPRHN